MLKIYPITHVQQFIIKPGLFQRKHILCLPYLILNAGYLILLAFAIIIAFIALIVSGYIGAGLIILFVCGLFFALAFYFFKVVQTEWWNIKDLDSLPSGQILPISTLSQNRSAVF